MLPKIHINDAIPTGVLAGYNAEGRVVCCIEMGAAVRFVIGTATDQSQALEWQMSAAQDKRFRWQQAWINSGFLCRPERM